MEKIILFHGTSKSRGDLILKSRCLKASEVNRVYGEDSGVPTSDNLIYFSTNLAVAVYYAQKTSLVYDIEDSLYVFQVELDKKHLLPDIDEVDYTINTYKNEEDKIPLDESLTLEKSIELTTSVSYPHNICAKDNNLLYTHLIIKGENNEKKLIDDLVELRNPEFSKVSKSIEELSSNFNWQRV